MLKKLIKGIAHSANIAALCGMVAVGAVHWNTAQAEQAVLKFTDDQMLCLQQNIFFEARGESELGQRAVAWVTLNRVADSRWSESICEVVFANKQFSWTQNGKPNYPDWNDPIEVAAWDRAGELAEIVIMRWVLGHDDPTNGADHFHATSVKPAWRTAGERTARIDNHIFYRVSW
jgi:N-acetylmuramoyl-L-alanine amidase